MHWWCSHHCHSHHHPLLRGKTPAGFPASQDIKCFWNLASVVASDITAPKNWKGQKNAYWSSALSQAISKIWNLKSEKYEIWKSENLSTVSCRHRSSNHRRIEQTCNYHSSYHSTSHNTFSRIQEHGWLEAWRICTMFQHSEIRDIWYFIINICTYSHATLKV